MSAISALVVLEGAFGGVLCVVGVVGDGDSDIEEREGIVKGAVSVIPKEIVFVMGRLG